MGDLNELFRFFLQPIVPAYLSLLIVGVMAARIYPLVMERWNERQRDRATAEHERERDKEAARAGDWERLRAEIERVDKRCAALEAAEEECRKELAETKAELGELKGFMTGQGMARQEAAGIVANERLKNRKDKP